VNIKILADKKIKAAFNLLQHDDLEFKVPAFEEAL
jgi:hypothetical protein